MMKFTMTKIAAGMLLAVAATGAQAVSVSTGGVFDMFQGKGYDQSTLTLTAPGTGTTGTDASISGFVDYSAGTWGVSSTTPFFGLVWTASGGTLIKTAGDYTLNTVTGVISAAAPDLVGTGDASMHFTVGAGQMAGAIDFAWGSNTGIRVVDVWNINGNGSLTAVKAPGMENGPFGTFNAAFHLTAPGLVTAAVPEASTYGMMLAGLGLVGGMVARRRKLMA
jgi:hypothetical protein